MPKRSSKPIIQLVINRVTQISDSHCGPAVIQMLLANLGVAVTQEMVAEAGGASHTIEEHGMRVEQLALAVARLSPESQFWYKDHSKLRELIKLVTTYRYPVGVEWQGLFTALNEEDADDDPEDEESDYGHYSVITHVDQAKRQLVIVDPYKDFISQDRIFSFDFFKERWWDTNEVIDPITGKPSYMEDYRVMFTITPRSESFPLTLGMKRGRNEDKV